MFLGQFEHNIDEKGRLTIPARYRELLGEDAYVTLGFDSSLMVLTEPSFKIIYDEINSTSITDHNSRLLRRMMLGNASKIEFDRAGRILIPQFLRQVTKLEHRAILVGQGAYFEIWSLPAWQGQIDQIADTETNARRFEALELSTRV